MDPSIIDKRKKEFLALVASIGSPVIKHLLREAIDIVEDPIAKDELRSVLDIVLPDCPLSARAIKFAGKQFYMVFKPCPDVSKYNIIDEIDKVKSILKPDKHDYLMKELSVTMSIIPNIYEKIMEDNPEFERKLRAALPEGRKKIIHNLIECETSTVLLYEDKTRYALYIEEE